MLMSLFVFLSACGNTMVGVGKDIQTMGENIMKEEPKEKTKRDRVQEQISTIPEWFKLMPTDSDNIFSAGTSVTPDMQFAIDAAVLNAKVILADRINSRLRSQIKQFRAKVGDGDLDATVMTVKNITANTDVSGYHIANLEVVPHGTQYRAYVLLEYSDAEARKILSNRVRKDQMLMDKIRATRAWRELDETAEQQKMDDAARVDAIINSEY